MKTILKGILFYTTLIYWSFLVMAAAPMIEYSFIMFLGAAIIGLILFLLCKKYLTEKDIDILTFNKFKNE